MLRNNILTDHLTRQPNRITTMQHLSPRNVFAALAFIAFAMMMYALYSQYYLHFEPCPLCMTQRLFLCLAGALAFFACIHNPGMTGRRIYSGLMLLTISGGIWVAGRHVWLQHLPKDQVPGCGPSFEYIIDAFPFSEALHFLLWGDGNCAEIDWTFLGFSMPEWVLAWFVIFALVTIWQFVRRDPS
jgi:disulfide bond formation protein DsbB